MTTVQRGQSRTDLFSLTYSWGSQESYFINTLPGIKNKKGVIYIFLWHTAQGRCDHSGTGLIHNNNNSNNKNKNPLILFSVYLKQFDMRQKREEGVVALLKWS